MLVQLTYGGLLLAVFAQQLCLPIPSIAFLMAAGALAARGTMQASIVIALGVLGCLAGDGIWFWVGRKWGSKAMRLLCRLSGDPRRCSEKGREKFRRYGLPILLVAKFFPGLDLVMPPLAAAEGVSVPAFLAFDIAGSALWSAAYVGAGYAFANQLELAMAWVGRFGTALGVAVGVPLGLYAGWRGLVLVKMMRHLRLRRISPPMLARRLKSNRNLVVVDLLSFEAEHDTAERIPGAFPLDPAVLRKAPRIALPENVNMILYCSSGSDAISARAAVGLKQIGIEKVWVLEGGLRAWREYGLPLSPSVEAPEVVAERHGVKLPSLSHVTG